MSAQPANTDIKVFRTVRSFRDSVRNDSIAALTKRLRPLIARIPGDENVVEVKARDTGVKDFSPFMGEARFGAGRGFPIVVGLKSQVSFANAQTHIDDADFAFQIGADKFIQTTSAGLSGDLYGDAMALSGDL